MDKCNISKMSCADKRVSGKFNRPTQQHDNEHKHNDF
jgi:hypothetical protein